MLNEKIILSLSSKYEDYVRKIRGYLHENPEPSGKEFKTSEFLKSEIRRIGLSIENVSKTGFIATMNLGKTYEEDNSNSKEKYGKTIVLRTDIDALIMQEDKNNLKGLKKYVSKNDGVCHSCGHDGHMAIILGVINILNEIKEQLYGRILFCFEQGEENASGVDDMIKALSNKKVDAILGMHLTAFMEVGTVSIKSGPIMAGVAGIDICVVGKGGHGSRPDLSINPIFGAAQVITALSSAWTNRLDVEKTVTLGLATIHGGELNNVIPDRVRITGTLRFFDIDEARKALDIVKEVSKYAAKSQNCDIEIGDITKILLNPTMNDLELSKIADEELRKILPDGAIINENPWFASETFSSYISIAPTMFMFVGAKNDELGCGAEHHNSKFDIDEDALRIGVISIVQFVVGYLRM